MSRKRFDTEGILIVAVGIIACVCIIMADEMHNKTVEITNLKAEIELQQELLEDCYE